MRITFKQPYELIKKIGDQHGHIEFPAGTYACHLESNPGGHKGQWVVMDDYSPIGGTPSPIPADTKVGASLNSITQWAGEAWEENEVILLDDQGTQMIHHREGLYSYEAQGKRITTGIITDAGVIQKHNEAMIAKGLPTVSPPPDMTYEGLIIAAKERDMTVTSISTVIKELWPDGNEPPYDQQWNAGLGEWIKDHKGYYYARPRELFSHRQALDEAMTASGIKVIVLEDMS
jgi:hypothetical protein